MDITAANLLASIENTENSTISNNIEQVDLPFIMSALEQNLSITDDEAREINTDSDDEDEEEPSCSSPHMNRIQKRRSLRTKSIDRKLHGIKRRTIAKPTKLPISLNASENEIRNYYMINSRGANVRSTNLETIFEEGSPSALKAKYFGKAKVRRSLNCSDGFNVSKTTAKARKNRVRRKLGGMPKMERMNMDAFLERLKALQGEGEDDVTSALVDPKLNHTI
ncbi:uncharacterized protein LOC129748146 [Uranotaenia lowii]|uniref:uncharacterized protein LOC129748146 n=1 Tax=Uranotaenia lowii TaxID=190385 RepID=UPI00247B1EEC|nr:uncharacterized protein LOC129748146 [Uranotaenia lowii]XP_055598625.1 uncharacterized protein LOC129748146 [Uranotaenia lowii]